MGDVDIMTLIYLALASMRFPSRNNVGKRCKYRPRWNLVF
jgi:hypothetical protein